MAIRAWWGLSADELAALKERLERLKAVLHPQIPRLGEQLPAEVVAGRCASGSVGAPTKTRSRPAKSGTGFWFW